MVDFFYLHPLFLLLFFVIASQDGTCDSDNGRDGGNKEDSSKSTDAEEGTKLDETEAEKNENEIFAPPVLYKFTVNDFVYWKNGEVSYYIDPEHYDQQQAMIIMNAFGVFKDKSCLKFMPLLTRPTEEDHVLLIENPKGVRQCQIDTEGHARDGPHRLILGYDCMNSPNIEMMIMHALGVPFEHNRVNRDTYISINQENIQPPYIELFTIESRLPPQLRSLPYDVNSVTHFGEYAFSKNGHKTINFKTALPAINGLSTLDQRKLLIIYEEECQKREREETIKKCRQFPTYRRKRYVEEHAELQIDHIRSLRVNPDITPPPSLQADELTASLIDLGVVKEVQIVVDQVNKVSALALSNARKKYCNGSKSELRTTDDNGKLVDILGIVHSVAEYAKIMVEHAVENLTEFCEDSKSMAVYQRAKCPFFEPSKCVKKVNYKSTKHGMVQHSTQHRPIPRPSTKHVGGFKEGGGKFDSPKFRAGEDTTATASANATTPAASVRRRRQAPMYRGLNQFYQHMKVDPGVNEDLIVGYARRRKRSPDDDAAAAAAADAAVAVATEAASAASEAASETTTPAASEATSEAVSGAASEGASDATTVAADVSTTANPPAEDAKKEAETTNAEDAKTEAANADAADAAETTVNDAELVDGKPVLRANKKAANKAGAAKAGKTTKKAVAKAKATTKTTTTTTTTTTTEAPTTTTTPKAKTTKKFIVSVKRNKPGKAKASKASKAKKAHKAKPAKGKTTKKPGRSVKKANAKPKAKLGKAGPNTKNFKKPARASNKKAPKKARRNRLPKSVDEFQAYRRTNNRRLRTYKKVMKPVRHHVKDSSVSMEESHHGKRGKAKGRNRGKALHQQRPPSRQKGSGNRPARQDYYQNENNRYKYAGQKYQKYQPKHYQPQPEQDDEGEKDNDNDNDNDDDNDDNSRPPDNKGYDSQKYNERQPAEDSVKPFINENSDESEERSEETVKVKSPPKHVSVVQEKDEEETEEEPDEQESDENDDNNKNNVRSPPADNYEQADKQRMQTDDRGREYLETASSPKQVQEEDDAREVMVVSEDEEIKEEKPPEKPKPIQKKLKLVDKEVSYYSPEDDTVNQPPENKTNGHDRDFVPRTVKLTKRNKEFYRDRKWPDNIVRYIIKEDNSFDPNNVRARIGEVNDILKRKSCVYLEEITEEDTSRFEDYVVLDTSPDYVTGRVGGRQLFGVVELLRGGQHRQHAAMMVMAILGFYFEVSRHDRDKYIRVHNRHIRPDKLHHFEKIRSDATFNLPYDYKSATHPAWQFWRQIGKTGISTVATFKDNDPDGSLMKSLGQNEQLLSDLDLVKINSIYGTRCFSLHSRKS